VTISRDKPSSKNTGRQMANDGYTPKAPKPGNFEGGYRPTTGQGPASAPASVPNQPSSVQPPKK
jgi:hypothetical protein